MIATKYADIKHLVPKDSVYDGNDYDVVLYHKGDYTTEQPIDLDYAEKLYSDYSCEELPVFVLIEGNFSAKNIFNAETDGSTGLIVLGNLTAENIVVGGQEIYVGGDLIVSDLYWGDYNHGSLEVKGTISIRVFLETDYGYDVARFEKGENINIPYILLDLNPEYKSGNWIRALFRPEFILSREEILKYESEIWNWKSWLNTETIFKALENGQPILLPHDEVDQSVFPKQEEIPFLFPNEKISYENLQIFAQSDLPESKADFPTEYRFYEYWKDKVFKRVFVHQGKPNDTQIYFQYDKDYSIHLYFEAFENKMLLGYNENIFDPDAAKLLDKKTNTNYFNFFREQWIALQKEFSEAVHYHKKFQKAVSPNIIEDILNLPLVKQKHSDYENGSSGIWFGNQVWQFRQESEKRAARITIATELENEEYDFYHYEFSGEKALLFTQDDNGHEFAPYEVHYSETEKYKEAIRLFGLLKNNIFEMNEKYLQDVEQKAIQHQKLSKYREKYSEEEAVGWIFIDSVLEKIYPDQQPLHFAPELYYMLGGELPLDGISVYESSKQTAHFHFITYGFSELYYNENSVGNEFSKFGFELSFRLKKDNGDGNINWVINLMQNIAKYVFKTGKWFEEFHVFPTNGPIRLDYDTELVALAFVLDPEVGKIETPHGEVAFLQMVGLTKKEFEEFQQNPITTETEKIVQRLIQDNGLLITDLDRKSNS